ncbi:hypothetical protein HPP92_028177 [Vanilla planifolia]|uniref:Uncharacterized protein n=1 Tax=Vanilla planifolia TaxID=51239 RepID=A0A835P8B9_VANPL|nr:hypothetical protein HPP92_028177 [Vanilla planifolia]
MCEPVSLWLIGSSPAANGPGRSAVMGDTFRGDDVEAHHKLQPCVAWIPSNTEVDFKICMIAANDGNNAALLNSKRELGSSNQMGTTEGRASIRTPRPFEHDTH